MANLTRSQRVALKTWSPANLKALWDAYLKQNPGAQLPGTGMAPNVGGFTPFAMPDRPPPGTYDPQIDAQERASGRGLGDLQDDFTVGKQRAQDDFLLAKGTLQQHLDRLLGDIGTARNYENEDYGRRVGDLTRSYDVLRGRQEEGAAEAGGFGAGGALQQALEKRTANMAHDRAPIDTGHTRALRELIDRETRAKDDFATQVGQLSTGLDRQWGDQGDMATQLARAGRENTQFGVDAAAQRWFQATQAGYDPPTRPKGQRGSLANPYKVVTTPRGKRRLYHTGYLVNR